MEITIPTPPTDKRVAWLEEHVKGFAEMRAVAERVRQEAEFSRAAVRHEERAA